MYTIIYKQKMNDGFRIEKKSNSKYGIDKYVPIDPKAKQGGGSHIHECAFMEIK